MHLMLSLVPSTSSLCREPTRSTSVIIQRPVYSTTTKILFSSASRAATARPVQTRPFLLCRPAEHERGGDRILLCVLAQKSGELNERGAGGGVAARLLLCTSIAAR